MVYDVATERPLKDHRKEHSSQPALFDDDRKPKKTSPSAISIEEVVAEWNRAFGKSLRATDGRKAALKARSKDQFFRDNWRAAIERASASDFCCGGGKDKWIADVDWFLKPDSVTRLMEGKYDNKQASAKASAGTTSSLWQQVVSACVSIRLEDPGYPKQLKKQFDESVAARIMQLKVRDIKAAADSRARGNDFPLKDLEKRFNELGGVA